MKKLSVGVVRARNIVEIMTAVAEQEGISRAEIAERASVSVMTVSNIMEILLRNGAVFETEQRTENVGRNPALVYLSRSKWLMVLDLTDYRFSCSFMTLELKPAEVLTQDYDEGMSYTENLEKFLRKMNAHAKTLQYEPVECIGISVCLPSVYNADTDTTDSFRIPELSGVPVKGTIRRFFDCEVIASADAKLAGIACNAELKQYAPYSMLYLTVDANVRGALMSEGNVLMGTEGYAGDLGQMMLSTGERLEACLLRTWRELEKMAAERECTMDKLWDVPEAQEELERGINALAYALYNACCVFSPYAIVLDGHCAQLGEKLLRRLKDYIYPRLVPTSRHRPEILILSHPVGNAVTGAGIRLREKWIKSLN